MKAIAAARTPTAPLRETIAAALSLTIGAEDVALVEPPLAWGWLSIVVEEFSISVTPGKSLEDGNVVISELEMSVTPGTGLMDVAVDSTMVVPGTGLIDSVDSTTVVPGTSLVIVDVGIESVEAAIWMKEGE
jgi:hypothetical protein